jgi:cytochrome c oxidase subunit II
VPDTRSEFHDLQTLYLPVAAAVLVIVFGATAFALVRYRARPGHAPRPTREHNVRELVIAAVIAVIVAVLLTATYRANQQEAQANRAPGFRVDVLAFKWGWRFTYPSLPGVVDRSGENRPAVLHVPANRRVRFRLQTHDVVHAFWVPAERFKRDAWPASPQVFDLTFGQGGAWGGHCAQYCGLKHSDMVFTVDAMSPGAFRAWAARARTGGAA